MIAPQEDLILFCDEDIDFEPSNAEGLSFWLLEVAAHHGKNVHNISYIFCSDAYLLKINQEHLQHDFYTDIITFPLSDTQREGLEADIFISVDRVRDNAKDFLVDFADELHRVMVHGLLHLIGFDDHSDEDTLAMRDAEAQALALRKF